MDNFDSDRAGRVCVSIQTRDSEANVLKWARVAFPYIGKEWGMYFFPEVGDQVLVCFEQGNIERPYVIGVIPRDSDKFLSKSKDDHNKKKRIVTKRGNAIEILDGMSDEDLAEVPSVPSATDVAGNSPAPETPGGDKITITTVDENHSIVLDDGKKQIAMQDKDKNCQVIMSTLDGVIKVNAAHKMKIAVGENIKISMNGDTGKLLIEARDINIDSTGKFLVSATGRSEIKAAGFTVDSTSTAKIKANTMVSVEGKPIKLG